MDDPAGLFRAPDESSMGRKKIRSAADRPSDAVLIRHISRLEQSIRWMAEGKTRNWKYLSC